MKKKEIEARYDELVNRIEKTRMYDGRGTVDIYVCGTCGHAINTTYRDKGVTPFTIPCPKCRGTMMHTETFKRERVPDWVEIKQFYRPTLEETLKMPKGTVEHILMGGLILEDEQ